MKKHTFVAWLLLLGGVFVSNKVISVQLADFPWSSERILVGLEEDLSWGEIQSAFENESGSLILDQRNLLKNNRLMVVWLDPVQTWSQGQIQSLMSQLERRSGIEFAHPFLEPLQGKALSPTLEVRARISGAEALSGLKNLVESGQVDSYAPNGYLDNWVTIALAKGQDPFAFLSTLEGIPGVLEVEPNYLYQISVNSNDTYFDRQWALENQGFAIQGNGTPGADMAVTDAWTITTGDPSVKLVIIDSGVDTAHVDLMDNMLPGFDATGNGSMGFPTANFPNDGHGTCCAGIAAAKGNNNEGVAGVCYDCSVVPVKLFSYIFNPFGDPLPFATGGDMADAISWAWQVGDADVISNSWGLTDLLLPGLPGGTGVVEDALDLALDSARGGLGVPVFFSSGNEGDPPIWPGRREGLFSVNASSMCDERKNPQSCDGENWSGNFGAGLDVAAPGVLIASTDMSGSNGYNGSDYEFSFNGTSAACPNAAGVMGLVLSVAPNLSLEQAHQILETTCDKVGGYAYDSTFVNGSWSPEMGYGRLNAFNAVQAAVSVAQEEKEELVRNLVLFPNPAREGFGLEMVLRHSAEISVSVMDIFGKELLPLVNVKLAPGSYRQFWLTSDLGLSAGMYLLKVTAKDESFVKKLALLD